MLYVHALLQQGLTKSDFVTAAMLEAASKGDQSIVQLLVKQFVNVEGRVRREGDCTEAVDCWEREW